MKLCTGLYIENYLNVSIMSRLLITTKQKGYQVDVLVDSICMSQIYGGLIKEFLHVL